MAEITARSDMVIRKIIEMKKPEITAVELEGIIYDICGVNHMTVRSYKKFLISKNIIVPKEKGTPFVKNWIVKI